MAFNARDYAKHLKKAGIKRKQAKAHAEAVDQYLRPELARKSEIAALESSAKADLAALERRIEQQFAMLEQPLERPLPQTQLQTLVIMAATLGILFALRRMAGHDGNDRPRDDIERAPDLRLTG